MQKPTIQTEREYYRAQGDYFARLPLPEQPQSRAEVQTLLEAIDHYLRAREYCAAYALTNRVIKQGNSDIPIILDEALDRWGEQRVRVDIYRAMVDGLQRAEQATALNRLGTAISNLGDAAGAVGYFVQAIEVARQVNDHCIESESLTNIALAYAVLGSSVQEIDYLRQAVALSHADGAERNEGISLGSLGWAYLKVGQFAEASAAYQTSLVLSRKVGDRRLEGIMYGHLGNLQREIGEPQQAIDYYSRALLVAQEIGDRHSEATWYGQLGHAQVDMGAAAEAIACYEQALAIVAVSGDRRGQFFWLNGLAMAHYKLGAGDQAIATQEQAIALAGELNRIDLAVLGHSSLARFCAAAGDEVQARQILGQIAGKMVRRPMERVQACFNIACAYTLLGECAAAAAPLAEAITSPRYCKLAAHEPDLANCSLRIPHTAYLMPKTMLELEIAIAKTNKYAQRESGDTVETVEQPLGGFALVMADGQGSGGAAKILSNMVVGKAIGLLKDGAKLEAVAALAHDYLSAYRGGKVTASLVIVAADLKLGVIQLSRNSDCPSVLLNRNGVRLLDEAAPHIGTGTVAPPALYNLPIEAGMYLVCYTDGLLHAGEKYDHKLNLPPLIATATQQPTATAQQLADHLLQMAMARDRRRPEDDMTILVLHVTEHEDDSAPQVRRLTASVPFELVPQT